MGYRTEQLYGENHYNPIEVMTHEVFELGNTDILDTLASTILQNSPLKEKLTQISNVINKTINDENINNFCDAVTNNPIIGHGFFQAILSEIKNITGKQINYVLWLCDTIDDIIESYEQNDMEETMLTIFDKYDNGFVILSDIGKQGKLYGYETMPQLIKSITLDQYQKSNSLSTKDYATIIYMHYLENVCQDEFSFDHGKTRKKIEKHYKKLQKKLPETKLKNIKKKIKCYSEEGTNYLSLNFKIKELPSFFLQVTSMMDYDGIRVGNYKGNCQWADVGMFFIDYTTYNFDDLPE